MQHRSHDLASILPTLAFHSGLLGLTDDITIHAVPETKARKSCPVFEL